MLRRILLIALAVMLSSLDAGAQTATNIAVFKGLAPLTILDHSDTGNAALGSNFTVTGGIQTGNIRQSTLLPFAEQQQQALRDVYITNHNLAQLSDGLGSTLGAAYLARAHYIDRGDNHFTRISQAVTDLIDYTTAMTSSDAGAAKYFFANLTTDGNTPVSDEAKHILDMIGGAPDIFGRSYGHPAGSPGNDRYGNSRPFQTEPQILPIIGPDYFNAPADNTVYNRGPDMNLVNSPSFPSGHTTYGYTGAILLAVLVPERYQQMIARGAEYGNSRVLMGAHYAMDVLGGRTLATYDMAHLLANDAAYRGLSLKGAPVINDYPAALKAARDGVIAVLQAACDGTIKACAEQDTGRFNNAEMNETSYDATQTYGLPVIHPENAGKREDVGKLAPEAGYLLTAAFPSLTLDQANQILTETEGPGGGFLDDGSAFGVYSRLNLYAAAGRAAQLANGH